MGGIKAPHSHLAILTRGLNRLLTHIAASQTQDTSVAAAEHAADDVSQDACAHLGLDGQNKGQRASRDSSKEEHPMGGKKINKRKKQSRRGMSPLGLNTVRRAQMELMGCVIVAAVQALSVFRSTDRKTNRPWCVACGKISAQGNRTTFRTKPGLTLEDRQNLHRRSSEGFCRPRRGST